MKRIPEPELMNEVETVAAYAGSSLDNGHWLFLQNFRKYFRGFQPKGAILDLGCGPAAITLRLAVLFPQCEVHGIDGAHSMLEFGKKAIRREGLENRVRLFHGILPHKINLPRKRYEAVVSNSFLHHLADPQTLWNAVLSYSLPGAAVLVVDLLRPNSPASAEFIVDTYVPNAPPLLRKDMLLSLQAAYTFEEVEEHLQQAGLSERLTLAMASPFQFAAYGYVNINNI
ncbi:MAG: class I SAM-dependent methyltransferase [Desulfopila sp.]|jgi:ubiquinone/menaquinone biosynthesis C-methylase UbiE|nr:class I SAM-dependent methyltransferase [Desulfopila sp.]